VRHEEFRSWIIGNLISIFVRQRWKFFFKKRLKLFLYFLNLPDFIFLKHFTLFLSLCVFLCFSCYRDIFIASFRLLLFFPRYLAWFRAAQMLMIFGQQLNTRSNESHRPDVEGVSVYTVKYVWLCWKVCLPVCQEAMSNKTSFELVFAIANFIVRSLF